MKTTNKLDSLISANEVSSDAIPMTIDSASSVVMMNMLGKLYHRPAQAVLREYLSNAVDAHAAKGGELPPIQITLPVESADKSTLSIRDFGKGMTEEEFSTILSRYGASTKRDTNSLIGGFGLGAKSGFSVADEFFMTSYQHGHGVKARIFKTNQNQGYVEIVERFKTSAQDGMLVEIRIPRENLAELKENSLRHFFLAYSPEDIEVKPNIGRQLSIHDSKNFVPLMLNDNIVGWSGTNPPPNRNETVLYAVIGKIIYGLDIRSLTSMEKDDWTDNQWFPSFANFLNRLQRMQVINLPIGSVDLPSSREEITLSERSFNSIKNVMFNYKRLMHEQFQKEINSNSYHEAMSIMKVLHELAYPGIENFRWRGKPVGQALLRESNAIIRRVYHRDYNDIHQVSQMSMKAFQQVTQVVLPVIIPSDKESKRVCHLLSQEVMKKLANYRDEVSFILMTDSDVLHEMFSEVTPISIERIESLVEEFKQLKQKEEEEKAVKELEERRKLTSFSLTEGWREQNPKLGFVENLRPYRGKSYYWSERELREVTKDISLAHELFPYQAAMKHNAYNISHEKHHRLAALLRFFLHPDSYVFIVGDFNSLQEFKTEHPAMESGVYALRDILDAQKDDKCSELNYLRAMLFQRTRMDIPKRVIELCEVAPEDALSDEFMKLADRMYELINIRKKRTSDLSSTYLERAVRVLLGDEIPQIETVTNVEFIADNFKLLTDKYPLLFGLHKIETTMLADLIDYINSKHTK